MKILYPITAIVFLLMVIAQSASAAAPDSDIKAKLDPKTEEVLRQTGDFYKNAKSLSVELSFKTVVQAPGIRREMWADYNVSAERPNKAAFILKDGMGITLVSNGKTQTTFVPPMNRFTQKDAPANLNALVSQDEMGLIDRSVGNMLFINHLLKENPLAAIQEQLTGSEYVGEEQLDNVPTHHIKLSQLGVKWDVWIRRGNQPVVLKVQTDMTGMVAEAMPQLKDAKMDMYVVFKNWNLNQDIPDAKFAFLPPPDASKVASLFEGEEENSKLVGKAAPEVNLEMLGGGRFNLGEHKGKNVVVLEFWASWCAPCLQGLPMVADVAKKYADKNVVFYSINQGEEPEVIQALMKKRKLDFNVAMDKEGKIASALGLSGIPFTMVIGKDGKIQSVHTGLTPELQQKLNEELQALVDGKSLVMQAF
jgi:peroxiredoxin